MIDEGIRISEFNELQFKMIRIHKLQDQINELWINPLAPNLAFGDYNYQLIISILENLYSEVHAKCKEEEQIKINKSFEDIEKLIEDSPIFESGNHPLSKKLVLSIDNWKEIRKEIKALLLYIKVLLDNHGFSPDKDSDADGL